MLSDRFQEAVRCLVKDNENKFDDCLVDHFFKSISKCREAFMSTCNIIADLYALPEFKDANQARIFKFHQSILCYKSDSSCFKEQNNVFWKRLPMIMENNNPSVVSAALSLLNYIAHDAYGYLWLMDKKFNRPLKLSIGSAANQHSLSNNNCEQIEIEDAASIARFYMEASKNYHIQNQAKNLLVVIMKRSCKSRISPLHRLVVSAKRVIEELMASRSATIFHAMYEILDEVNLHSALNERYNVQALLRRCFDESIENDCSRDIISICKCLAMITSPREANYPIDKLKQASNLEAILAYVSHLNDDLLNQSLLIYIIYPILTNCDSEDAQVLIPKLFITREERNFIDRSMKDKFVTTCIGYLKKVLKKKAQRITFFSGISHKRLIYFLNVISEYVKCNYASYKSYKNILECCSILKEVRHLLKRKCESIWLFQLVASCHTIIEQTNIDNCQNKAVLMEMIQVVSSAQYGTSLLKIDKVDENMTRTVELAFKFDDHDVWNEFAEFFIKNSFNFKLESDKVQRYVELIWNHMCMNSRDTDNRDLLGNITRLLVPIDLDVEASILTKVGIRRHHDIPMLLGDLLINCSTVHSIVEDIIACLHSTSGPSSNHSTRSSDYHINYLCFLNSSTLPKSVRKCLDNVIKGLCMTVKGESAATTRRYALEEVNKLIEEFLINSDDAMYLIERLVKTEILETLYEVITGTMYSDSLHSIASFQIPVIKKNIIKKLDRKRRSEIIVSLITKDNPDQRKLERAQEVANFYISDEGYPRVLRSGNQNDTLSVYSFLEDILNQQGISKGISECY